MRPFLKAILVVACASACLSPGVALGQEPSCTTLVVTEDTTLDRDVICGRGTAIEIGAPNVTLDLGGHVVASGPSSVTIRNQGYDGVTIKNGRVGGDTGGAMSIEHAARNTVRDLEVKDYMDFALRLIDVDHSHITRNHIVGYVGGLSLREGSDRNVVSDNDTSGLHSGLSVSGGSSRNLIIRNTSNTDEASGVYVGAGTGNVLAFNTASSHENGLFVDAAAERTLLVGNRANGSDREDGIHVESRSTVLIGNTANDNGDYGIEAVPGVFGIANRASGNGQPAQCLNVRCR